MRYIRHTPPHSVRSITLAALLILGAGLLLTPVETQGQELQVVEHPSGGFTVAADDGFDLWFDAWGEGPGLIFLARSPDENRPVADALSDAYRVVIMESREISMYSKAGLDKIEDANARAAAETHLAGRNLEWNPSGFDEYPIDVVIGDLHRVADAAGIEDFVLGGYSGTARQAAFLAPYSDRAVGVIVGGYHILGSMEYWMGYIAGASAQELMKPDTPELTKALTKIGRMQLMLEHNRDAEGAYGKMTGPKIVWVGSQDGEPDDALMDSIFWGSKIAHRVRSARTDYEELGFQFFQLDGMGHMAAYMATDKAAPLIREALIAAGYE